jgi:hypothetical protein
MTSNVIENRLQLEPMLLRIMSTPQGQADLAAFISEIADELRLLSDAADARAERDACKCCICCEQSSEQEQLRASVQAENP